MSEKDRLLQELDRCHQELSLDRGHSTTAVICMPTVDDMSTSRHDDYKVILGARTAGWYYSFLFCFIAIWGGGYEIRFWLSAV